MQWLYLPWLQGGGGGAGEKSLWGRWFHANEKAPDYFRFLERHCNMHVGVAWTPVVFLVS
jgi:hypothetical protein